LGSIIGVILAWAFMKTFKVKPSDHILIEVIGISIGCILPIIIYLIIR